MTLNKRAKLGIALAIAVLAGLTSGLAGMLVLVLAWLLIVWGQAPERTETFVGGLPGGNYLLKAMARIDLIFWPTDSSQKDLMQEEQEELHARSWDKRIRHRTTKGIWHKRNISEKSCGDIAPKLDGDCAS